MLSEYTVRERAITWYAIAYHMSLHDAHAQAAAPYSKSDAYMHVLAIPHSKQCGRYSVESLQDYAKSLVDDFLVSDEDSINTYLSDNINPDFCLN